MTSLGVIGVLNYRLLHYQSSDNLSKSKTKNGIDVSTQKATKAHFLLLQIQTGVPRRSLLKIRGETKVITTGSSGASRLFDRFLVCNPLAANRTMVPKPP